MNKYIFKCLVVSSSMQTIFEVPDDADHPQGSFKYRCHMVLATFKGLRTTTEFLQLLRLHLYCSVNNDLRNNHHTVMYPI